MNLNVSKLIDELGDPIESSMCQFLHKVTSMGEQVFVNYYRVGFNGGEVRFLTMPEYLDLVEEAYKRKVL